MAFRDGLGERRVTQDSAGAGVEALCLRRELAAVPSFEFALRERVTRLASFRHAYYGRVRGIERSNEFDQALTVMSDATPGIRLSALLDTAHEQRLRIDLDVALCLIRQLVPAVAILHESARDASHGAIGPERLIVAPNGRLVIVEYVLGSALEQLLFTRERYWTELRVALPRVAGLPRFDHLADVTQIGVVALSLILGRTLRDEEYPARIGDVLALATVTNAHGEQEPLPAALRSWLQRALQLDARNSFPSAIEARGEFERALADSGYDASPQSLDAFLRRFHLHDAPVEQPAPATTIVTPIRTASAPVAPLAVSDPVSAPKPVPAAPASPTPIMAKPTMPAPMIPVASTPVASMPVTPMPITPVKSVAATPPPIVPRMPAVKEPSVAKDATDDDDVVMPVPVPFARKRLMKVVSGATLGVVVLGAVALIGMRRFWKDVPAPSPTGTLVVTTNPAGAEAFVDGVRRGNTPLTVQLLAGSHRVELRGHGEPREIPVNIAPGQQVAQYVDLPAAPPPVETKPEPVPEPPAPVDRAAAETSNAPGWITVNGKLEVQLFENGHLLGSSNIERIMVPAGRHDLEMVSELIGYRATRTIQVAPGKLTTVAVDLPKGAMAINALPWAEVWMDGAKIGDTPIGNFAVAAGSHDIVFRNPDLGEKRETVLVTLRDAVRLSVDMRKP